MIYINFLQYIWRKNKTFIYILYFLIFCIHFLFVHCAEWGSFAWFPGGFLFLFCFCAPSLQIFLATCRTVCGDGAFFWGFSRWVMGWNFCILCSGCHYLLYFVSLLIIIIVIYIVIIIIIIIIILVGVNYTHPFLLMWAIANLS